VCVHTLGGRFPVCVCPLSVIRRPPRGGVGIGKPPDGGVCTQPHTRPPHFLPHRTAPQTTLLGWVKCVHSPTRVCTLCVHLYLTCRGWWPVVDRPHRKVAYLSDVERERLESAADEYGISESEAMRRAIREFTDYDRADRVESKVDRLAEQVETLAHRLDAGGGHTHTEKRGSSTTPDDGRDELSPTHRRTLTIFESLRENHEHAVPEDDLELTISNVAGSHPDTLDKYKRELKRRGFLHESPKPNSPVWLSDRDEFFTHLSHAAVPHDDTERYIERELDPYPIKIEEFAGWAGDQEQLPAPVAEVMLG